MLIRNRKTALMRCLGTMLVLTAGCLDEPTGLVDPTDLVFAPELGVRLAEMTRTSSGLYLQDQVAGTGAEANTGASITVDYTGWLHNGRQFDSSAGRGPLPITNLGGRQVIAGWDEGLLGMRVGGRRLLVIPPHLAYGATGAGNGVIPPHATLVFRVELRTVVPR